MEHLERGVARRSAIDAAFAVLWDHLVVADPPEACDAIFCFGSRSRSVPNTAAGLYRRGIAPLVVVTGGAPGTDGRSEADAYAAALEDAGVPAAAIVLERHARHTGENVLLGLDALHAVAAPRRIVAVSWALAMRRAVATFARHRPDLHVLAAPALPDERPRWDAEPQNIRDALGEWDRLGAYGVSGHIAAQPRPPTVEAAAKLLRSAVSGDRHPVRSRRGAPPPRSDRRPVRAPATSQD